MFLWFFFLFSFEGNVYRAIVGSGWKDRRSHTGSISASLGFCSEMQVGLRVVVERDRPISGEVDELSEGWLFVSYHIMVTTTESFDESLIFLIFHDHEIKNRTGVILITTTSSAQPKHLNLKETQSKVKSF